jgi:hypothetical protein
MSLIAHYRVITFDELFILYSIDLFVQAYITYCYVLGYIDALMSMLFSCNSEDFEQFQDVFREIQVPPNLSADCERPPLAEAVADHVRRFTK